MEHEDVDTKLREIEELLEKLGKKHPKEMGGRSRASSVRPSITRP